jgi:hypothetical protein
MPKLWRRRSEAPALLVQQELPAESHDSDQRYLEGQSKYDAPRSAQFVFVVRLIRIVFADISDIKGNYGLCSAHNAQLRPHRLPR